MRFQRLPNGDRGNLRMWSVQRRSRGNHDGLRLVPQCQRLGVPIPRKRLHGSNSASVRDACFMQNTSRKLLCTTPSGLRDYIDHQDFAETRPLAHDHIRYNMLSKETWECCSIQDDLQMTDPELQKLRAQVQNVAGGYFSTCHDGRLLRIYANDGHRHSLGFVTFVVPRLLWPPHEVFGPFAAGSGKWNAKLSHSISQIPTRTQPSSCREKT